MSALLCLKNSLVCFCPTRGASGLRDSILYVAQQSDAFAREANLPNTVQEAGLNLYRAHEKKKFVNDILFLKRIMIICVFHSTYLQYCFIQTMMIKCVAN